MRVYLTVSGSGEECTIGEAADLLTAATMVYDLDAAWQAHEESGASYDSLPADSPLRGYEGCDIYATDGVRTYSFSDDYAGPYADPVDIAENPEDLWSLI